MQTIQRVTALGIVLALAACDSTGPGTGSLELTVHTTGRDLDPDGYTASVDGSSSTPLPSNGTATIAGLALGDHAVTLAEVAPNCVLQGSAEVPVTVPAEGPGRADLEVVCALANTIAYVQGNDVHMIGIEPGAIPVLVAAGFGFPSWSADGGALALAANGLTVGIFLTGPNGENLRQLTPSDVPSSDVLGKPAWSPDGRTLLFNHRDCFSGNSCLYTDVKRVDTDATGYDTFRDRLNQDATWAPDGTRIAFGGRDSVCLANPDGSDQQCLTRGYRPVWSPDGGTLAFGAFDTGEIHTIGREGSDERILTPNGEYNPAWSPDGEQIAFGDGPSARFMLMNADGSGRTTLAPTIVASYEIAWSFDGEHLAFTGRAPGDNGDRIYVIKRDGTGLRAVTGEGVCCLDWRP